MSDEIAQESVPNCFACIDWDSFGSDEGNIDFDVARVFLGDHGNEAINPVAAIAIEISQAPTVPLSSVSQPRRLSG